MSTSLEGARLAQRIVDIFEIKKTLGEIRSNYGLADEGNQEDLNRWIVEVLQDVGLNLSRIRRREKNTESSYLEIYGSLLVFRFYYENAASVLCVTSDNPDKFLSEAECSALIDEENLTECFLISKKVSEEIAAIPGIEKHWFFSALWKNRRLLLIAGVATLLTNLFALVTSLFSLVVYNKVIPAQAMNSLAVLLVGVGLIFVCDYLVKVSRGRLLSSVSNDADSIIADRIFSKIIDMQYASKTGTVGGLANTLKEYEIVRDFMTSAALLVLIDLPFAVIFLAVIFLIGQYMIIPVLAGIFVMLGVSLYIQPRLRKIAEKSSEDNQSKHSVLIETLTGLDAIKLLGAGGLMRRRFREVTKNQAKLGDESKEYTNLATNVTQEVQQIVLVGVVAVGAVTVSGGSLGFGAIIACSILSGKAVMPFTQLAQLLMRINQIVTAFRGLDEFMRRPSEHESDSTFTARNKFKGSIEFKNVSFAYPRQEGHALKEISFNVQEGERVAIVGKVGSGKSTIGKLISKLFSATDGEILIDGIDSRQIDPAEIRQNIGYVSQEPWLIAGTLEKNITLGDPTISSEDLIWAAELSGAAEFINRHPDGFNRLVGERGEGLSGGQRQSIAVARALVRRPSILVFDEPTSSMDAKTERSFVDAFRSLNMHVTLILITHRTSLLSLVNNVIVLDNGSIAGAGPVEGFLKGARMSSSPKNLAQSEVTS